MAQIVKRLLTMQETRVQSLGQEDALEKEMATHSSILAWKIPWVEEPGRLEFRGSPKQTFKYLRGRLLGNSAKELPHGPAVPLLGIIPKE